MNDKIMKESNYVGNVKPFNNHYDKWDLTTATLKHCVSQYS